jgi:uncharacterized Zn finger protein
VTAYIVCRTCGRYVTAENVVNRAWCSEECTRAFSSCANCGTFFPAGRGFDKEHCHKECTVRYQILRKYGPQPVTVVTEV